MRYVCLLISMLPAMVSAQDGAAIYKERCASCHDATQERVPSIAAIKAMSGEAIYLAHTNGAMKSLAEGLSTVQIFALIGYIAPTGGTQPGPSSSLTYDNTNYTNRIVTDGNNATYTYDANSNVSSLRSAAIVIAPPGRVNLIPFEIRLNRACLSRRSSASITPMSGGQRRSSCRSRLCARSLVNERTARSIS